jgi:hypothetical protein
LPDRLVFTYREDEVSAYHRLVALRRDRGPQWHNFEALMIVFIFAVGFAVLLANQLGLVASSEMPHVLFAAYAAFFAGALAHRTAMGVRYRAIARARFRSSEFGTETFEMAFDPDGIGYDSRRCRMHVPWTAIVNVVEAPLIVVLLFDLDSGLPIPARLFADATSKTSFVAAMREHASAARRLSSA